MAKVINIVNKDNLLSNVKVRPLVLNVTEIPFKIHSVDGWEGGAGRGAGAALVTRSLGSHDTGRSQHL